MGSSYNKKAGLFHRIHWKPVRFVQLFVFLILVILLSPILNRSPLLTGLLAAFFLNILIVTLSFSGFDIRLRWPIIGLWLLQTLLDVVSINLPSVHLLYAASDVVKALLLVVCVFLILRYVFTSHEVTLDTIFGAFVAYFLIAFAFSSLYQALSAVDPSSFSMPASTGSMAGFSREMTLNYFSFVTIATLGYGDIVPRVPVAQMLSILEAVIGQFYMAGVVAWLVSVFAGGKGFRERRG